MSKIRKQTNYHFQYSIGIDCTQDNAWQLLTEVKDWPKWDTELKKAHLIGDFKQGAKGTLIPKSGPKLTFQITKVNPGKSYTFETKLPIGKLLIFRKLVEKDGFIHFTDDIQFIGIFKRLFGFILGKGFKSVLPEVMQNFKNLVESKNTNDRT